MKWQLRFSDERASSDYKLRSTAKPRLNIRLSASQVEERLEDILGAVLSSRRTASKPAQNLSELERPVQDFALHWAGVVAKSNSEMAFQFVENVIRAFELMDFDGVEAWIVSAMDTYDRNGLYPGSAAFREVSQFAEKLSQNRFSATLESHAGVLEMYLKGVSGRSLAVKEDQQAWTDTETLYLPETVDHLESRESNFQLLKSMSAYLWAQTRFGTFRVDAESGAPILCTALQADRDTGYSQRVFEAVEEVRLLACMERELPGLARQMRKLRSKSQAGYRSPKWDEVVNRLTDPDTDVRDSLEAMDKVISNKVAPPCPSLFRGVLDLERVRLTTSKRIEKEKSQFQKSLSMLMENMGKSEDEQADGDSQAGVIKIELKPEETDLEGESIMLTVDGTPIEPPPRMIETASSIIQDFGGIPDDYLVASGGGDYDRASTAIDDERQPAESGCDGIPYDEWDYRRKHYRKNWCILREKEMQPGDRRVVEQVLERYSHLVGGIRKTFEAMRGDDRLLRKQKHGDDIDIEAVVEGYVDTFKGMEMPDRLFTNSRRLERDLAVVFMVDLSGSTKGWINDAERDSLILLCEALETLDDRYAIYGFSGMTRKGCNLF